MKTNKGKIKDSESLGTLERKVILYDKSGSEHDTLASDQVMAEINQSARGITYSVRVNLNNDLYNPNNKMYIEETYRMARNQGTQPTKMVTVNKETLEHYVTFLRNKMIDHLKYAQKGV